ncbi:MAG: LytTR family transcriptional regulator [Lactobacillus sp.]|jgi:DNA-binding LytR/AlgR family response regulator|nr:LytTR family transcriptional regulator [Lactobacillus sp.]MCI2034160.1 LytTR family transcriptional regulator [Lactobacillus sp.]
MKIYFDLAAQFLNPAISIQAQAKSPQLLQLAKTIDRVVNQDVLTGIKGEQHVRIAMYQVIRFYTQNKNVVCETTEGTYRIRARIYQLRERLPQQDFIAISSSEILRIAAIKAFSLTKGGEFAVDLTNGAKAYASRRYIKQIKEALLS